jgi:hypothetical protein
LCGRLAIGKERGKGKETCAKRIMLIQNDSTLAALRSLGRDTARPYTPIEVPAMID